VATGIAGGRVKAWRVHEVGEPQDTFVLEDVPPPTAADLAGLSMDLGGWVPLRPDRGPFADWVILDMRMAALALPDVTMSRGTYPVPVIRPYISGQEGVGVVTAAAPAWQHMLGKRVAAVTIQPWGSLAPVAVGVSMIFEVPEAMSDEQAAGFLIPAHTAFHAAIRRGQVQAGERVLVLGAAGGLGAALVQLSIAQGAQVVALVGDERKAAFCESLGAAAVLHTNPAWQQLVRDRIGGGVDVILDPVQGQLGASVRPLLVPNGRHVLCGHAGGLIPHDPDFYLYNYTLVGVDLGGYPQDVMLEYHREAHEALNRLMIEGKYRPVVEQVIDFEDVPAAMTDLAERRSIGRIAVRLS
jgi:NADPH2:quinone reductase